MATLNLERMEDCLSRMHAARAILGDDYATTVARAADLVRAFRAGFDLSWNFNSADLYAECGRQAATKEELLAALESAHGMLIGMDIRIMDTPKFKEIEAAIRKAKGGAA